MHPVAYLVMIFGSVLAVTGIVLFIKRGAEGTSSIKIFGIEFSLGGSSLVVFVLGVILFILPFVRKDDFPSPFNRVPRDTEISRLNSASGKGRKTYVLIYSHQAVFTSDDALKLKNSLNTEDFSVQIHEHSGSGIPDSIYIGVLVSVEDARNVIRSVPYEIKYIFRPDYPEKVGGDPSGLTIGIGYLSSHTSSYDDIKLKPIRITKSNIDYLIEPGISNTEFQHRLREITSF